MDVVDALLEKTDVISEAQAGATRLSASGGVRVVPGTVAKGSGCYG